MTVLTEGRHPGEFIISEGNRDISREALVIAADQAIEPNMVLGRRAIVANLIVTSAANAGNAANTGALTLADPKASSAAKPGVYSIVCVEPASDAGQFEVRDPAGKYLGKATVAVAYDGEVKFTIADGATNFVAGEGFTIKVEGDPADFEYAPFDQDATDGLGVAAAISIYGIVTEEAVRGKVTGIVRLATVNGHCLVWPSDIEDAEKALAVAALEKQNIIVRN